MRHCMVVTGILMPVLMGLSGCDPQGNGNGNDGSGQPQIGSISGNGEVEIEVTGLIAQLTAVPDEGWRFVRWEGPNDVSRSNPHNVGAAMLDQYEAVFLHEGVPNDNGNDNGNDNMNDNSNSNGEKPVVNITLAAIGQQDPVDRFGQAASIMDDGLTVVTGGVTTTNGVPPAFKSVSTFTFYRPISRSFADFFRPSVNNQDVLNFDLLTARSFHTQSTMSDNRILIAGGDVNASGQDTGDPTATAEIFDPALGTVEFAPDMGQARSRHTATTLSDGRILVAGGTAWQIFDATTDQWSAEVNLAFARESHAAALLSNFGGVSNQDRVLIVGGDADAADKLELIDPQANTSTALTSTLPMRLTRLTATTLPDSRVLVVGGVNVETGDTTNSVFLIDAAGDVVTNGPAVPDRDGGLADHRAILEQNRFVIIVGGEQDVGGAREVLSYYAVFDTQSDKWVDNGETLSPHDDFIFQQQDLDEILISGSGQAADGDMAVTGASETMVLTIVDGS